MNCMVAERCHSAFMKNLINHFFFSFFINFLLVKLMYFSRNVSTKIKFNLKMKKDMAGNCESVFLLRLCFEKQTSIFLFHLN